MEKIKTVPFFKSFSFKVFLFNALLLLSLIAPTLIIRNMDYKHFMDRISFQRQLFDFCMEQLSGLHISDWQAAIEAFPKLFYQQRICIFHFNKELIYDSGIMKEFDGHYAFTLLLPDPYIDWREENKHFDPGVYITHLQNINLDNVDPQRLYVATRSVRYAAGLDRIVLFGRLLYSAEGGGYIFTMSQSVVDILIQDRSIKERFLILYALVILLSLLLTVILSWSVTNPLKRLYNYSQAILVSQWREHDCTELPEQGEIGAICQALQGLIKAQKKQSENYMRFSSDIVHELKTPLAAIRSGLEVYSESPDAQEKGQVYDRINRRIRQMENLMNEIQFIGCIESNTQEEHCKNILAVCDELLFELKEADIALELAPGIEACALPVSCEKLHQILINLVRNAVSFSPAKGSVSAALCIEDHFLVIRVRDQGPGIPEEVFSRITERFFTYRPGYAEQHSGLGLSIVDAILRGCGGYLEYRNRAGGGAEFTCRIPEAVPPPAAR